MVSLPSFLLYYKNQGKKRKIFNSVKKSKKGLQLDKKYNIIIRDIFMEIGK